MTAALHVTFKVGPSDYALPAASVLHLDTYETATPVPGAPPYVAGLVQTRGTLAGTPSRRRGVSLSLRRPRRA